MMRNPPPWMLNYIHRRVGERAAVIGYQVEWQMELSKSKQLVEIEDRERTVKLRKVKSDRLVL